MPYSPSPRVAPRTDRVTVAFFGARKAIQVTSADVAAYRVKRQEASAAAATVNRELAALKRMFSLAVKRKRLQRMPYTAMLKENNARRHGRRAKTDCAKCPYASGWV